MYILYVCIGCIYNLDTDSYFMISCRPLRGIYITLYN